ncbi:MAG: tetratricopeptide repeat protein, partial [Alphaproteobacteria bacterium]|nr:tetratricopeptide repeat protein [Alphaproteobacteria bacterium]
MAGLFFVYDRLMKPDQRWARADALLQPGIAAHRAGRLGEAEAVYRRVIDQVPGHPGALNNLGMIFRARGDSAAAEAAFRAALVQQPHFAEAHYNRGNALANLTRIDEAIEAYRAALRYRPNYADAWFNLGNRLGEQGDAAAAKVAYLATLALKPDHVMAHIHLGNLWFGEMRLREALSFLDLALALTPNWGIVHNNRGRVLEALKHYAKALDAYAVAVVSSGATQEPDNAIMRKRAQANLLRLRQEVADWSGYADLLPIIERDADETMAVDGVPVIGPMTACRISDDPAFHRQIIAGHARQRLRRLGALAAARTPAVGTSARKIVLAYLSSTINENPTGFLLQGVIAHHDRDRFDVVVYNYGISADNPVRRAIRAVTPAFHDVSGIDSRAIAVRIRQDQCAILIDANVWADDGREDIAGRRPAPVQVRLGGVPCT